MNQLELAKKLLGESKNVGNHSLTSQDLNLADWFLNIIKTNLCSTISISYDDINNDVLVTLVYLDRIKLQKFHNFTVDAYIDFCTTILNLNENEEYNCSRTKIIEGVRTRIFAIMKPLTPYPLITISTTKNPPATLSKTTIPDSVWDEIVHNNFILVGASGSGKTYMMNYLLNKFIKASERILFVEEFGELIPPNELTQVISVPPSKPREDPLLDFVTRMSNLMRMDAVYVGEVKGKEAWPMILNMSSGTRGGTTVHGKDTDQGLARIRALCQLSCNNDKVIDDFISKSIKYSIEMDHRQIVRIYELTGVYNNGIFNKKEINS